MMTNVETCLPGVRREHPGEVDPGDTPLLPQHPPYPGGQQEGPAQRPSHHRGAYSHIIEVQTVQ